jgi:hypothetical protein
VSLRRLVFTLALACVATTAWAQPMMMDPSKMSGIPRPDPQVPAGTITVRLIRGQLDKRMVGVEVGLTNTAGAVAHQKTDAEGRATFAGLAEGTYLASAKDGDTELKSQPMELQPDMGTRVMLVFPSSGLGAADGIARVDKELPAGTLIVRAEDAAGQAVEGLAVVVGVAKKGEPKIDELRGTTDVAGEAKFEHLEHEPTTGYLVEVMANGAKFTGKPFRLDGNIGMRDVIQVRQISTDMSMLSFAEGSHFLCEITDDSLQIIEMLRLHNAGTAAVDVGGDGFHIPLPLDAVQIQATEGDPHISIVGKDAVYRGPIPPGDTQVRVGFVLAREGSTYELTQRTPIPIEKVVFVTQQLTGLSITGNGVVPEPREMQGRKLYVYFGDATQRGGVLHLSFAGLPAVNRVPAFAAGAVAILIVLVLGVYAIGGGGGARARLERERRVLFDEVARIDRARAEAGADVAKLDEERARNVARLAEIYHGLDDLGVG